MTDHEVQQLMELWHDIYRMHSYVESVLHYQGGPLPGILQRADQVLKGSRARVDALLPKEYYGWLEPVPERGKDGELQGVSRQVEERANN